MLQWLRRLSRRDRKSAPQSYIAWHTVGRPAWSSRDTLAFAREGFGRNPIAYRCVRLIAEAAASARLKVTPEDHPLATLLSAPNPEQTATELLESFFGHLQVAGNSFLEAASLGEDPPRELHVLRPDRMAVIPGARGWPIGWEHRAGAQITRFERDPLTDRAPILHLKLFAPADDWYGQSPMEAAAAAIDIHNAGGAWNKALIDNAARPSGALVYSGAGGMDRLTEDQFSRLKAELSEAHMGAANAGRPLLLEGGLDWKPMSLSPADMDFMEARHAASRDIALAFGVLEWDLWPGPVGRWDRGNYVQIRLVSGTLESVTDEALFAGANTFAVEQADGGWEVLQARDVTLMSPGVYQIRTLLRGQVGTAGQMGAPAPAGGRIVKIDRRLTRVSVGAHETGASVEWRAVASPLAPSSSAAAARSQVWNRVWARPFPPAHVRGARLASGDVALSWVRRTRLFGDDWAAVEVPLNEDREAYQVQVQVMDGPDVVRAISVDSPAATYSAAAQIADFGAPPTSIVVRVAQLSSTYGAGGRGESTIWL